MRKKTVLASVFIVLFLFGLYFYYVSVGFLFFIGDHQLVKVSLKEHFWASPRRVLTLEVVKTAPSTAQGLSARQNLTTDGMLFVFPNQEIRHFWMKDMLFEIDICWLHDLTLDSCVRNASPSPTLPWSDQKLKTYRSPFKTDLVLETKPGEFDDADLGLKLFFKW